MIKRPKYHQGKYISDPAALEVVGRCSVLDALDASWIAKKFLDRYRTWIESSQNNQVKGLDLFPYADFTQGCTESFTQFYLKYAHKRFRIFKGEYASHLSHFQFLNWCWIEDEPLRFNDVVIISLPFANSGRDKLYKQTLKICELEGLPILVDCCWFGTCADIDFDFSSPAIKQITFSLSKTFPVSRLRIGARFSKTDLNDGITDLNKVDYVNRYSAYVGYALLTAFSPDYIFDKYRSKQISLCSELDVNPSNVVSLATSYDEKWNYLYRGDEEFRLCLSDSLR